MGIFEDFKSLTNTDINNLWLYQDDGSELFIDPSLGPDDNTTPIGMRILGVTFENIYKNIASYPNKTDMSNENSISKTFYLEQGKIINVSTLLEDDGNIIRTTISGDTTLDNPVVRITTIYNDIIKTIYEEVV